MDVQRPCACAENEGERESVEGKEQGKWGCTYLLVVVWGWALPSREGITNLLVVRTDVGKLWSPSGNRTPEGRKERVSMDTRNSHHIIILVLDLFISFLFYFKGGGVECTLHSTRTCSCAAQRNCLRDSERLRIKRTDISLPSIHVIPHCSFPSNIHLTRL